MKKIAFNDRFALTQAVLDRLVTQHRVLQESPDEEPAYKVGDIVEVAMSYKDIYEQVKGWRFAEVYRKVHEHLAGWDNKHFADHKGLPFETIKILHVKVEPFFYNTVYDCEASGAFYRGKHSSHAAIIDREAPAGYRTFGGISSAYKYIADITVRKHIHDHQVFVYRFTTQNMKYRWISEMEKRLANAIIFASEANNETTRRQPHDGDTLT